MPHTNAYFPNAVETLGTTYYVAQRNPFASDNNPGSLARPFKTITKAASVADMGDAVVIDEGIYREQVPIVRHGHRYMPTTAIAFKAAAGKQVFLKGSDAFEPQWQPLGNGVFKAELPDALFAPGAYNPYELSAVINEPAKVRPADGDELPETLGQVYVDRVPLEQLTSLDAVERTPGSFVVTADGREIVCHFADGRLPTGKLVELTVRERCFRASAPEPLFINTMGMVVEHAANPGPFCFGRPVSIRRNANTGIVVRKRFVRRGTIFTCEGMGWPSYATKDKPTLIATIVDDTVPGPPSKHKLLTALSDDSGKSWRVVEELSANDQMRASYFFDEDKAMLVRHYIKFHHGRDPEGAFGALEHDNMCQVSADGGQTWSEPQRVDQGRYYFRIIKLADGRLLWPYTESMFEDRPHSRFCVRLGAWRDDLSGIDWAEGGTAEIAPEQCSSGLDEPMACQLPDGRIFVLIRAGNVLPTQHRPGVPSVKLFVVSDDGGETWTEPKPLTYQDGEYVYSPRAYPDVFRSSKNGRVYVMLNISGSTVNCDPRTSLNIAELDPHALCVKRDTVGIIDAKHPQHHGFVRYSNWTWFEDRYTGNIVMFAKLHMSELCPVRKGYDFSLYRYEIELPA